MVAAALPLPSLAQPASTGAPECTASLSPTAFHRVPILLNATVSNDDWREILPGADLLAQSVAMQVRSMLGASESELPAADSAVGLANFGGSMIISATRNGRLRSRVHPSSRTSAADSRSALSLIRRALAHLEASGESLMWPERFGPDTVEFSLTIHRPLVDEAGKISPVRLRQPIAVFTLGMPWETPVEQLKEPRIFYPERSRNKRVIGRVQFTFIVDEQGRVDVDSIEEVVPDPGSWPAADIRPHYQAFVAAVKRGLPSAEFRPAIVAGCPKRQLVVQSFEFTFR